MKKNIHLILTIVGVLLASSIFWYFSTPKAQAADLHVNSCGVLSTAATTYILDNDVSSTGTCFVIDASDIVLNLNGHTITFNTSGADNKSAFSNIDDTGAVHWNKRNIRITNGNIAQSPVCQMGNCYLNNAVYFVEESNLEVDHLNISYQGDDNFGIYAKGSGGNNNVQIHDNIIRPNGTKRVLNHYGGFSAISVGATGGNIDIYNNDIQGKGYSGIGFRYSSPVLSETLRITNNTIKMASPVRDGYAISLSSGTNQEVNFEIANNTIVQSSGRGILINGDYDSNSAGPGSGTIHDNNVDVREAGNTQSEGYTFGNSLGIQLRFGAHNIKVFNNVVNAHAGNDACPKQFSTDYSSNCQAIGIKVVGGLYAKNNEVYNNTVNVETNGGYNASGLYGAGTGDSGTSFHNNTVTSNSVLADLGGTDGSGSSFNFNSNTFIKGVNPQNFRSINVGFWINNSTGNTFLDNNWQNGAEPDNVGITGGSPGDCSVPANCWHYDLATKWYLNLIVKNSAGALVSGANVSAVANGGATETVSGITDSNGVAKLALSQYKRWGLTYPQSSNYDRYTPHTIIVSKDGVGQGQATITMDATKSLELILSPTISLTKQVDKVSANPGDTLTYSITYSNPTLNSYTNARIEDIVPTGTTFISATNGGILNGTKVVWNLGNIAPDGFATVSFQARVQ